MPQSLDSLPPPAMEWRRESDEERKQRLERAGVIQPPPAAAAASSNSSVLLDKEANPVERLKQQVAINKEKSRKSYLFWWSADAARWRAVRSPRDTSTMADGSWSLGLELTHPEWILAGAQFSFGPKAVFYNGGQYAKLSDPFFTGNGYANFSVSEFGFSASLTDFLSEPDGAVRFFWTSGVAYAPLRWVIAERTSSAATILRSDTYSKTALNLPGIGLQASIGVDWNSLLKIEAFAGIHGAWPVQIRLRTGVQLSMGLSVDALPIVSR